MIVNPDAVDVYTSAL